MERQVHSASADRGQFWKNTLFDSGLPTAFIDIAASYQYKWTDIVPDLYTGKFCSQNQHFATLLPPYISDLYLRKLVAFALTGCKDTVICGKIRESLRKDGVTSSEESGNSEASEIAKVSPDSFQETRSTQAEVVIGTKDKEAPSVDVFISHSSNDVAIAEALILLIRDAIPDLPPGAIRCTTVPGYKLSGGADTDNKLRQEMLSARVFIGLLTNQSLASTYVLFELGARWGSGSRFSPLVAAGLPTSGLKAPLSGMHAQSCEVETDLHQMLGEIADWLDLKRVGPEVYDGRLKKLVSLSRSEREQRAKGPLVALPLPTARPHIEESQPNLVLVRVLTESLIYVGDEWRRAFEGSSRPTERIEAVFAEIKNAKSASRPVGQALGVKAELTVLNSLRADEFSDLAWIGNQFNTVNFDFAETHYVLLAVNIVSHLAKTSEWVIPLNHRGFKDHTPGISKTDLGNSWKTKIDTRLRLDMLHIKTGTIVQRFDGQCVWRDGHKGPKISFNPLS
jgi:hypothetical protein